MAKTKIIHPDRDPGFVTGAYSDGVLIDGFLYVSGQACVDFKTSTLCWAALKKKPQGHSTILKRSSKLREQQWMML